MSTRKEKIMVHPEAIPSDPDRQQDRDYLLNTGRRLPVDDRDSMRIPVTPRSAANTGRTAASQPIMATITCGCGFSVTGRDEARNQWSYEQHPCPNAPRRSWHKSVFDNVFSFWGAVIAFLIIAGIVKATGHGNF